MSLGATGAESNVSPFVISLSVSPQPKVEVFDVEETETHAPAATASTAETLNEMTEQNIETDIKPNLNVLGNCRYIIVISLNLYFYLKETVMSHGQGMERAMLSQVHTLHYAVILFPDVRHVRNLFQEI